MDWAGTQLVMGVGCSVGVRECLSESEPDEDLGIHFTDIWEPDGTRQGKLGARITELRAKILTGWWHGVVKKDPWRGLEDGTSLLWGTNSCE